jgi:hypothetical protein
MTPIEFGLTRDCPRCHKFIFINSWHRNFGLECASCGLLGHVVFSEGEMLFAYDTKDEEFNAGTQGKSLELPHQFYRNPPPFE